MDSKAKVLLVDDEEIIRQLVTRSLSDRGFHVETAEDGIRALEKARSESFNVLITDLKMPGISGTEVLREVKRSNPYVEVIVITGYPTIEAAVETLKIGAYDFLCKPFNIQDLFKTVTNCLERQQLNLSHLRQSELKSFFDINRAITQADRSEPVDSFMEHIIESALSITKARKGSIFLLEPSHDRLSVKAMKGMGDFKPPPETINLEYSIFEKIVKDGKPVLLGDKAAYDRSKESLAMYPTWLDSLLIPPLACIPLRTKRECYGVMYIGDREDGGPFTEREYTLLLVLAGEVGIAIENSNLYADLQSKIVQLEHVVQELNNTQNQLIQSEKLASIGQLASGIAHEIRNPLGTILSGLEFLSSTIAGKDSTADEAIGRMKQSISRANNIIVELLKFSRASKMELKTVDMRGLLDEVVDLLENQIKTANICVKKNYPGDPAWVCIDITLMRQVIFNLITNAIDAMPNGGELTMSLRRETGEQGQSEVVVEIGDTGCGIPEDKINRIFDPFFTTKEPGKGTGLGLSISHLILERHKAAISVKSLIEKGTTFTLRFSGADTP